MPEGLKNILIVTKADDTKSAILGKEMTAHLSLSGIEAHCLEHSAETCRDSFQETRQYDLILILGGDGTFIAAARWLLSLGTPFMGVNLGRVGFLTQLHRDHWKAWLSSVITTGLDVAGRMTLEYEILRGDTLVRSGTAINDLVVSRGVLARLVKLGIAYDGVDLSTFRADGVIISTPTGSTAYGVSAGGPLLHADLFAYSVTPICPFLNSFKPLVVPADKECMVMIAEERGEVSLTVDGQTSHSLYFGDRLVIRRCATDLLVVNLGPTAYFEKLKKHGFLTEK